MQQRPPFLVLELTISAIEQLAPLVASIRRFDRDLADQIRRAASSIALNIGEGNRRDGGSRRARFCTAAGSNAEVRAALRVAVAWGYVRTEEPAGRHRASFGMPPTQQSSFERTHSRSPQVIFPGFGPRVAGFVLPVLASLPGAPPLTSEQPSASP